MAHRPEGHDPAVVEDDHNIEKEVHVTAGQLQVEMHVTNWVSSERGPSPKCYAELVRDPEED